MCTKLIMELPILAEKIVNCYIYMEVNQITNIFPHFKPLADTEYISIYFNTNYLSVHIHLLVQKHIV